ncbi:hypothetical protein [Aliirhizobium cellulosilyticum]|uniref:Uncharacterized protein n=1 Tax=Aliirhizobium cellulosilyticum TaxID=393664 RepID=A0A7W6X9S8_9HYPH|nr:hypothetical protein [Rhizobium cellulosilyticum]MBB4346550.1 hypothetical protein [Rhizobium cellulosilyticum]MBB4411056.1 hypothetical protein [Rhizobium cellulosilyticum]MBB4445745.1 hypothetical protein [Rhizobium cellulosilyticum]
MTMTPETDDIATTTAGERKAARVSDRRIVALIILVALISLIPVLSVRFPPITDYANHYVRLWLLAGGIERPMMSQFYQIDWNVAWTNIAIDLLAFLLGKIATMDFIAPFVLGLALLLPPIGVTLLNRKLFGGFHWWQLLCFALAWNAVLLFGFLSFSISLGLALVFAYLDECLKHRGLAVVLALRAICAAILLTAHPFGLLFYTALLAALAFGPSAAPLRQSGTFAAATGRVMLAIIPVFLPLVIFLLFGPSLPGQADTSLLDSMHWDNPSAIRSLKVLLIYFRTYDARIDMIYLALFIVLVRETIRYRTMTVHWGLVLVAIVTGILSMFMPTSVLSTGGMDVRLPCMMTLAAAAGLRPQVKGRLSSLALPLVLILVVSRTVYIEYVWLQRNADIAAVERALQHVEPGSAVLPAHAQTAPEDLMNMPVGRIVGSMFPSYIHYPALVSFERDAFMPYLFTAAGKQPLRVREPWQEIAVPEGIPIPTDMLNEPAPDYAPYMADWKSRFDYVLVLNADMASPNHPMPAIDTVHLVADEGFASLYRIEHPSQ